MSLIVLIGVTGSGKTTVGRELSRRYELPLYEVDEAVEARLGASMRTLVVGRDPRLATTAREEAERLLRIDEGIVTLGGLSAARPSHCLVNQSGARKRRLHHRAQRRSFRGITPRRPRRSALGRPGGTPRRTHPANETSARGVCLRGRHNSGYECPHPARSRGFGRARV